MIKLYEKLVKCFGDFDFSNITGGKKVKLELVDKLTNKMHDFKITKDFLKSEYVDKLKSIDTHEDVKKKGDYLANLIEINKTQKIKKVEIPQSTSFTNKKHIDSAAELITQKFKHPQTEIKLISEEDYEICIKNTLTHQPFGDRLRLSGLSELYKTSQIENTLISPYKDITGKNLPQYIIETPSIVSQSFKEEALVKDEKFFDIFKENIIKFEHFKPHQEQVKKVVAENLADFMECMQSESIKTITHQSFDRCAFYLIKIYDTLGIFFI